MCGWSTHVGLINVWLEYTCRPCQCAWRKCPYFHSIVYAVFVSVSARNIGKPTRVDSADRESLVPSAADDDTFKDGVVTSSRSKKNAKAQRTIPMTQLVRARRPRND